MKDFLSTIVEHKKHEVEGLKNILPEDIIKYEAFKIKEKRPFLEVMAKKGSSGINIIAEIKRASPSKGIICPDLDASVYASYYEKGGASAISVLTDNKYFKGSIDDLEQAKRASNLPVLRKDFIISTYQIYESKIIGADAILLIVRILSQEQLQDYLNICDELNLDALVEVYSEEDVIIAKKVNAKLIGINNRNLSSFDTDIKNAMNLASMLDDYQIPVAASGIHSRDDINKNLEFGIWNFLIGESIVKSDEPVSFLRSLLERS
ncbi:MAG: indole-3-glycerol phosphate synthase TrpC [Desulfobacterales bacterium]|nr:indole-3-glycerol phosphate synthase TrpC [Desulfobacterales bacterium]